MAWQSVSRLQQIIPVQVSSKDGELGRVEHTVYILRISRGCVVWKHVHAIWLLFQVHVQNEFLGVLQAIWSSFIQRKVPLDRRPFDFLGQQILHAVSCLVSYRARLTVLFRNKMKEAFWKKG